MGMRRTVEASARGDRTVALIADHSSPENSRTVLAQAIAQVTGGLPVAIDARQFMVGGSGRVRLDDAAGLLLDCGQTTVAPDVVLVYEIDPVDRHRIADFLDLLVRSRVQVWGAQSGGWRNATDKERTIDCFARDGIPHAETITLRQPDRNMALEAFDRLGGDVWVRPVCGLGGRDVFHLTTTNAVLDAVEHYAVRHQKWQMCRDAGNIDVSGNRHQFRVVVYCDRVLRVCEHVQRDHDRPCNESQGAVSTVLPLDALAPEIVELAIAATHSVGLSFGGVDVAVENGGTVFEVNVHPALDVPGGLETVALPLVNDVLAIAHCFDRVTDQPIDRVTELDSVVRP